ncbi:30S ribosomal protein S31, chloroplastic-like [Selaginella moellendorffii]|uniref:30S ribosomal protein S31, chloroplastic-like n=1 Tax=Selaginella moellendorffii TaxID=88036 RepID=UPI000D1D0CD8|nr:30S ribosomal protein S31, chloroplastic-like [Selaginella moellendorffii]|eukprot:XP_024544620.1 30S ribosomal protein S31, chloroplastic-like [Selaginella moellendorffii]
MATAMASNRAAFLAGSSSALAIHAPTRPAQLACVPSISCYPSVYCGRGDKRTAKGKRFRHSFGNSRPRKRNKGRGLPPTPLPPKPADSTTEGSPAPEPAPAAIAMEE